MIGKWDILKLSSTFGEEFDAADFTADELKELLGLVENCATVDEARERYFEFYDDIKDRTLPRHKWSD